jgi:thioredoxin-dependent peroxiredoxin
MKERANAVKAMGKPLTLLGEQLNVGDKAPDATVLNNDVQEVKISSFRGKILIIASVPSIDTPVCSIETRSFNQRASEVGPDIQILTISMDLPFAQKRWCAAEGIDHLMTLSDHRTAEFGEKYGVLIKESRLLARVVFIVDKEGIIRYIQAMPDLAMEPDYDEVLQKALELNKAGVPA